MKWVKTEKTLSTEGVTIKYEAVGTAYSIESRKRNIPHSGRSGTWEYTSYFVLCDGDELCEKHTLRDAKEVCERLEEKR